MQEFRVDVEEENQGPFWWSLGRLMSSGSVLSAHSPFNKNPDVKMSGEFYLFYLLYIYFVLGKYSGIQRIQWK